MSTQTTASRPQPRAERTQAIRQRRQAIHEGVARGEMALAGGHTLDNAQARDRLRRWLAGDNTDA